MRAVRVLGIAGLGALLAAGCDGAPGPASLESDDAKLNYSVGYQIGGNFESQKLPLDEPALLAGLHDAIAGNEAKVTEEERRKVFTALSERAVVAAKAEQSAEGEKNLAVAKAFLEQNAKKEGVVVLPSGLQYKVLTQGQGPKPATTDTVTVHYKGTLVDGTEFDSSYGRGEPATFALNRVIRGWTEGVALMPEGSKWILYVPPDLGYGERGAGSKIPPQSALVFEVELLRAKAK